MLMEFDFSSSRTQTMKLLPGKAYKRLIHENACLRSGQGEAQYNGEWYIALRNAPRAKAQLSILP